MLKMFFSDVKVSQHVNFFYLTIFAKNVAKYPPISSFLMLVHMFVTVSASLFLKSTIIFFRW